MNPATKGWSRERRSAQAEHIKAHKPWRHSTGPRTTEGKARSSRNAHKHGFYGAEMMRLRSLLHAQRAYVQTTALKFDIFNTPVLYSAVNRNEPRTKDITTMADLNIHDGRDVLQHLKDCGWTGQPMTNMGMVYAYYGVNADDFLNTFRSLEQDGYIEIAGKRTLDDLAAHIDERMNAPETNTAKLRDYSWAEKTFRNDDGPVSFFSNCSPRLTLRGRYALATGKDITIKSMPPVDLDAARQAFAAKKAAEELEAEKGKPMKAFRDVLGAVLNDKARKDFKWDYAVEYWGEESWNAFHRHENLVETNTTYREAFNKASKAFAKNILCSDKHEDKTLDGSFLSHIIGNPFTRTLLLESFLMAAHPVNSYKLLTNLHKVETIYKDSLTGSSAPKTS